MSHLFDSRRAKRIMRVAGLLLMSMLAASAMAHMHMGHEPRLGASAAFAPDGRLWVVSVKGEHVVLRHSDDAGQTLSAPVIVNAKPESISASGENRPKIALGPQGDIYVSWTEPLAKPYTGRIRFARSTDGGKHFSAPITVHHDRAVITHRFGTMAVDTKGRILIAWIDKRDLAAARAKGKSYRGAAVYYAWSDNRGASFTLEQKLADHSCECCRIAMARAADGGIGIFWRSVYPGDIRDHTYAEWKNGRISEAPARATDTQWKIAGCPHQGPGLTIASDGTRHGVWFSAAGGKPVIWYGQLDPGHDPRHLQVMAHAGASHADVIADGQTVWVVWNQMSAEGMSLMRRVSHDGGGHFGDAKAIAHASGAVASPQLLREDRQIYVAWNTDHGFRLLPMSTQTPVVAGLRPLTAAGVPKLLRAPTKGKRVIALWALDCIWCEADLKALDALHRKHPDIEVVTVSTDDISQKKAILQRLRAADATHVPAMAYATVTPQRLNYLIDPNWAGTTPHTLIIDASGSVKALNGQLTVMQLKQLTRP
ncbi:MAG TPA: exo-alpha-sialidase [Rhodanobacteraceae bacterium]|nr:exo-alpha-sialidase [Rhodanobacteraceae bacterium]